MPPKPRSPRRGCSNTRRRSIRTTRRGQPASAAPSPTAAIAAATGRRGRRWFLWAIDPVAAGGPAPADAQLALAEQFEAGRQLGESLRNPLETYEDSLTRFNDLLEAGAISWETWGRAAVQAAERLIAAQGTEHVGGGAALSEGSNAAISAVNRARLESTDNVAERTARAVEAQRRLAEQQLEVQRQLLEAMYGEEGAAVIQFMGLPAGGG